MTISIGNDHAGTDYKFAIIKHLEAKGITIKNYGTDNNDSVDYPDFVHPVADDVENKKADFGIIICGSGNGANMTANKHQGIRSAICWTPEIASLAKQHNNANICTIPARFVSEEEAIEILTAYLSAEYEGGRHQARIEKIPVK